MNNICKTAALGLVIGAFALTTGAQAKSRHNSLGDPEKMGAMKDGAMAGDMKDGAKMGDMKDGAMAGDMKDGGMSGDMMGGGMMMTPSPLSGTVLRYYTDRAGFVSAMDVQAADGVKRVCFSPSMAQRIMALAPVTSQIAVSVTSARMGSMMAYNLAGIGADMPTPATMIKSTGVSDVSYLRSQPYIQIGTKSKRTGGTLTGVVTDPDSGEVLAIILDKTTFVRVPANNRIPQASTAPEGVTALFRNSDVVVNGYDESPRYGTVSAYSKRIVATGISVGGRTLGAFGFGALDTNPSATLFKFNLNFFGGEAPEGITGSNAAFTPYDPSGAPGMMMKDGDMKDGAMAPAAGTAAPAPAAAMPGM